MKKMVNFVLIFCLLGFTELILIEGSQAMELTSPHFKHNEAIPKEFTCQGDNISPALNISGIPEGTKSLALIVDDPDAPVGTWTHWIVFDISPSVLLLEKNSVPGKQGRNSWGRNDYGGPCPPSGIHRYFFKLYALGIVIDAKEGISKKELENAMDGHILSNVELIGLYKKTF